MARCAYDTPSQRGLWGIFAPNAPANAHGLCVRTGCLAPRGNGPTFRGHAKRTRMLERNLECCPGRKRWPFVNRSNSRSLRKGSQHLRGCFGPFWQCVSAVIRDD